MTPTLDHLVAAGVKGAAAADWLPHVEAAMARYAIDTPNQVAAWLAQTAHESGGYTMLTENLNYRAATLAACWPTRFAVLNANKKPVKDAKGKNIPTKVAEAIAGKPELIANMVYSGRMGNGTADSGEGWKYRGRGLKQLTGKDNYARCGSAIGLDLVGEPDLLLQPEGAALSAAWFWHANKCGPIVDGAQCSASSLAQDFTALTKKINGGTIGLEDRARRYKAVLALMG